MATLTGEICDKTSSVCQIIQFRLDNIPIELISTMPFDGAQYFAFSFIAILSCWLFSLGLGQLLNFIKRA
ncbi:MAG: hypothetical protein ACLTQE_14440 [Proteus mirabilis]